MRARMMIIAAGLVAAFAASAPAQSPLQGPVAPRGPVALMAGGKVVGTSAGCNGCSGQHLNDTSKCNVFRLNGGTVNPVGCGCWESEKTFFWGSCRNFFSPKQTCGNGCGNGGGCLDRFRNNCPLPIYGTGVNPTPHNCAGPFSYTFR